MEHMSNSTAIVSATPNKTTNKGNDGLRKKKKRGGFMHLIRATLFMLGNKSSKPKPTDAALKWKNLIGSMRPLHVQSQPLQIEDAPEAPVHVDEQLEVFKPPFSPDPMSSASSSYESTASSTYGGMSSQFTSAASLVDLDECGSDEEEEEEEDSYFDDKIADEMIDEKAEQFIAQFYHQMQLQRHA